MTTLLVGRGLLGGHIERRLRATGEDLRTVRVPWQDHDAALAALLEAADRAARQPDSWRLVWCAGPASSPPRRTRCTPRPRCSVPSSPV